jgi:hypothetical protein
VQEKGGSRYFEDVFESSRSYYDTSLERQVQLEVGTDGVDEFGDTRLEGPRRVEGFSTMIAKFDAATHEPLPGSEGVFVQIHPQNFPGRKISIRDMRLLTQEVHDYVMKNPDKTVLELLEGAETLLHGRGWIKAVHSG